MQFTILPIRETILLRQRLRAVDDLRRRFLAGEDDRIVHDLRVASRRLREVLDYLQPLLSIKTYNRLRSLARSVTRTLGKLREAEVNLNLLLKWQKENRLDPIAAEILIAGQRKKLPGLRARAEKELAGKQFSRFRKFLVQLKGSRRLYARYSDILEKRRIEFMQFSWIAPIDDERLHDLRIRTKKFRYAFEIYDRLHQRNLGRFTARVRRLQEVLGTLHDLYVLSELLKAELQKWENFEAQLIATALQQSLVRILEQKQKLSPSVQPLYNKVVEKWNEQFPATNEIGALSSH